MSHAGMWPPPHPSGGQTPAHLVTLLQSRLNSRLNTDCVVSAQSARVSRSANTSPCRTALSCSFGRHRVCTHRHIRADRGHRVPSRLLFPSLCCSFERIGPFSYLLHRPKTDLPVQPMGELSEDPRPIAPSCLLQSIRGTRRWAIHFAYSPSPRCRETSYLHNPPYSRLPNTKQEYSIAQC